MGSLRLNMYIIVLLGELVRQGGGCKWTLQWAQASVYPKVGLECTLIRKTKILLNWYLTGSCIISYYHETTFWQSTTLWFVSLDTKGFQARNCSGLCLNYLIHKSWFFLVEIGTVLVALENGTTFWQNVTECQNTAETAACQMQSPTSDWVPPCQRMTKSTVV